MEDTTVTLLAEEPLLAQCSFNWDSPEPYSVANTGPDNHAPAGSPEQEPDANLIAGSTDESPTPVNPGVGGDAETLGAGIASGSVAAEPGEHDAGQGIKCDPGPTASMIPTRTGREGMSGRAVRAYSSIGALHGLTSLDLSAEGDPLFVDIKAVKDLRPFYMAVDKKYGEKIKDRRAGEPVNIRREHRRAWDRARQEIWRGLSDLVRIFAADEVVETETGKTTGYRVYRLPEVRRRQFENGAKAAIKRPGGGRVLVDSTGSEIGRQPFTRSRRMQQPESQAQETVKRDSND